MHPEAQVQDCMRLPCWGRVAGGSGAPHSKSRRLILNAVAAQEGLQPSQLSFPSPQPQLPGRESLKLNEGEASEGLRIPALLTPRQKQLRAGWGWGALTVLGIGPGSNTPFTPNSPPSKSSGLAFYPPNVEGEKNKKTSHP